MDALHIYRDMENSNENNGRHPRSPDTRATLAARARMLAEIITDRSAAENLRSYADELEADLAAREASRCAERETADV